MHPAIHFRSARFDPAGEPPNPVNPIAGASLLAWLSAQPGMESMSAAAPEDWGWFSRFPFEGRDYLIGAVIHPADDGLHECVLQVSRRRTWRERLAGTGRMQGEDPVLSHLLALVRDEPAFRDVTLEH